MDRQANIVSIQKAIEAHERMQLNAGLRQMYVAQLEKVRAARDYKLEAERRMAEERLKQEARQRFMLANPFASEADFHCCWLKICDEMTRQRAQRTLEEIKSGNAPSVD